MVPKSGDDERLDGSWDCDESADSRQRYCGGGSQSAPRNGFERTNYCGVEPDIGPNAVPLCDDGRFTASRIGKPRLQADFGGSRSELADHREGLVVDSQATVIRALMWTSNLGTTAIGEYRFRVVRRLLGTYSRATRPILD